MGGRDGAWQEVRHDRTKLCIYEFVYSFLPPSLQAQAQPSAGSSTPDMLAIARHKTLQNAAEQALQALRFRTYQST